MSVDLITNFAPQACSVATQMPFRSFRVIIPVPNDRASRVTFNTMRYRSTWKSSVK